MMSDDYVLPFQLEGTALRGRLVRLGATLDRILARHAYPEPVAQLLGEAITLAATLAGALKGAGVFTLQTRGDGPVRMLVADVSNQGDLRGYAQFDEALWAMGNQSGDHGAHLLGAGHLAFTLDQRAQDERYQGIVPLQGQSLAECVQYYFRQSEQISTGLSVAVGRFGDSSGPDGGPPWRGGALLLQQLPQAATSAPATTEEDSWRHAMVLMGTATGSELLDPALEGTDLLWRLFHEQGVRVWDRLALRPTCRCSTERVAGILRLLPATELQAMQEEAPSTVTCEFCGTHYHFSAAELAELAKPPA